MGPHEVPLPAGRLEAVLLIRQRGEYALGIEFPGNLRGAFSSNDGAKDFTDDGRRLLIRHHLVLIRWVLPVSVWHMVHKPPVLHPAPA